jgi:hypothetical protein
LPPEAAISGRAAGEIRKLKGFRDFIVGGNVIERAIAVVIGIAFNVVISALVKNLLTLLIAAIIGKPNVAGLTFTVNKSQFLDGDVLTPPSHSSSLPPSSTLPSWFRSTAWRRAGRSRSRSPPASCGQRVSAA